MVMGKSISLTIGKLAREAGVGIATVRYYQKRGLVDRPAKPGEGGFRHYGEGDIGRIRFIKRAQHMGFTLAEIAKLSCLLEDGDCSGARILAENKRRSVESQLATLGEVRAALTDLLVDCTQDCRQSCTFRQKLLGGAENTVPDSATTPPPPKKYPDPNSP